MDGATGTALEWALALLHAPAERHRLRQRPLPSGMTELLTIAADLAPEELGAVAARVGEQPARVREAARFYAREVLFHAQTDAYRTLGVMPDAPTEQIKLHSRLLQAWLHPDREQSGDDAVFAAKVNAAWNRLRTDKRRAAYDAERAELAKAGPIRGESGRLAKAPSGASWPPPQPVVPTRSRWRHRALVLALVGICAALGWQVFRMNTMEPESWGREALTMDAERMFRTRQVPADNAASHETPEAPVQPAENTLALPPVPALDASRVAADREPTQVTASSPPAATQESLPNQAELLPKPTLPSREIPQRSVVFNEAKNSPIAGSGVPTEMPRPLTARRQPQPGVSEPDMQTMPRPAQGDADGTNGAQRTVVNPVASGVPAAPGHPGSEPGTLFGRLRQAFGRTGRNTPATGLAVDGDVAYAHIQQARQVGQQYLRYIVSENRAPPIWDDAATLSKAEGLRSELRRAGTVRMEAPQWRVGETSAALTARYSIGGVPRGVLAVGLVWREDRWLVNAVGMDALP